MGTVVKAVVGTVVKAVVGTVNWVKGDLRGGEGGSGLVGVSCEGANLACAEPERRTRCESSACSGSSRVNAS